VVVTEGYRYRSGMRPALLLVLVVGAACARDERPRTPAAASIDDVDRGLASGRLVAVDANSDITRAHMGTLPGAVLLSDYASYPASELPAEKARALVFYCANEECTASHEAAARAIALGYADVEVMPDGIAGWVRAGKRVSR
jgi:rhodanese-related sulfurtransferase